MSEMRQMNSSQHYPATVSIPIATALPKAHRLKRKQNPNSQLGKIGLFVLILMIITMFVAIHSRQNEMVYVALIFVLLAIALFTYGFWSAVSKGEGVWQYIGKHNLQHQQVSNPNYHFGPNSRLNYKGQPKSKVHVHHVAPPKMGGVRLEIYTLAEDDQLRKVSLRDSETNLSNGEQGHHSRQHSRKSRHHHHHHHHRHKHHDSYSQLYHQQQKEKMLKSYLQPDRRDDLTRASFDGVTLKSSTSGSSQDHLADISNGAVPLLRPGHSCINLPVCSASEIDTELDPIKVEVNLSRSASHQNRRKQREGFEEVQLPELKQGPIK